MKIQFYSYGFKLSAAVCNRLKETLERLPAPTPITNAAVVLEHRRKQAPSFRAFVLLAVSGPDIHAEACDHSLEAAWLKIHTALRKQFEQLKVRQFASNQDTSGQVVLTARRSRAGVAR